MAFVKRPTSPLAFEPLETQPEELIWPGSDDDLDEDVREKKRLRREILGRQYLEGRPLFIQTAGLKGPFDRGWSNPWANKGRSLAYDSRRVAEIPPSVKASPHDIIRSRYDNARAKRKSVTDVGLDRSGDTLKHDAVSDESVAKRVRRQNGKSHNTQDQPTRKRAAPKAKNTQDSQWLKSDKTYPEPEVRDGRRSPTPTPLAKPRNKLRATPGKDGDPSSNVLSDVLSLSKAPSSRKMGGPVFTPINARGVTIGRDSEVAHAKSPRLARAELQAGSEIGSDAFRDDFKGQGLPEADLLTRRDQHSPHKASHRAEAELRRLRGAKSDRAVIPDPVVPQTSRLSPYISDYVVAEDNATSAPLKASSNSPRPSTRTVPPSRYLPEFPYRHTKKGLPSKMREFKPTFTDTSQLSHGRPRSVSQSSSGSSEFAEQLEAAQAKAISRSIGSSCANSSYPSSPIRDRPESASVKRNTQALRRLTFTASGEPKIATSRSITGGSSALFKANAMAGATSSGSQQKTDNSIAPAQGEQVRRGLATSVEKSVSNGNVSHSSIALPEAQKLSDQPLRHAQLVSGPSTELIETDKQSPKVISLGDEDSYINLSTQAAMAKAQRSFQDDVLSPLKTSPVKLEKRPSPTNLRSGGGVITPLASERNRNQNINQNHASIKQVTRADSLRGEEAMSTQAMADAISPFAITTIKKRPPNLGKRTSVAPSPTRERSPNVASIPSPAASPVESFQQPLSMSTSSSESSSQPKARLAKPSPKTKLSSPPYRPDMSSRPPSSLTSFSVLPNGSTTETSILQDGQQQLQPDYDTSLPLDPFTTPLATAHSRSDGVINGNNGGSGSRAEDSWDLKTALDEAGSFLGNWDVEVEARKEGSSSKKGDGSKKGILSAGRPTI